MRKIALISESALPLAPTDRMDNGAQNICVSAVARHLARAGYQVDVFTRCDNITLPERIEWEKNLHLIYVPAGPAHPMSSEDLLPSMEAFGNFMLDYFRRQHRPYDVVHANSFMSGHAAIPLARQLSIPLVVSLHARGRVQRRVQGHADRSPACRVAIEDDLLRVADCIITECEQDKRDLIAQYGASPQRIEVLSRGFDPAELAPVDRVLARSRLGWPQRRFTILQLGSLEPCKGIDNLIRALALLRHEHRIAARLYIVGGNSAAPNASATPEIGRLTDVARQCGVLGQVLFVGRRGRQQLRHLYSAADVFVSTPWYEPFGITPIEAMACGVPVIGPALGGPHSAIVDGLTGYLVPAHEPAALAGRLAVLAGNARERGMMGEAGRQRAHRLFTWSHVCRGLAVVYERVIGKESESPESSSLSTLAAQRSVLNTGLPAQELAWACG
jgi:D-inositol-3-phosphate glycosyltransferase